MAKIKKKVTLVKMDSPKQKPKTQEAVTAPEQVIKPNDPLTKTADDLASFENLDTLFHVHEDNWALVQDGILLDLILSENGVSDSQRIRYLLKRYRDLQREINNC